MKTVSFGYDTMRIGATNLLIVVLTIFLISIAFILNLDDWLFFIPVAAIIICTARFFIINFSLPAFKDKPALVLDEEKLISFVSDVTIYWTGVAKVTVYHLSGYFLFEMNSGEMFRIGTKWVDGDTSFINTYVQEFMSQAEKKHEVHFH